ncbi:DNA topoisomerase [Belnapia moabensis]|uniref:DNA topoisomerase n=1 Tax=Belnapia moabensis TaxID=365533 RepID=UPI0005BB16CD|nr:DNA topoisomerase [Belnapia moabensis]
MRAAFASAKPNTEYARLHADAVAPPQADQIHNLSFTYTATETLTGGARAVIGAGQVKTPTLAIVFRRKLENRNFVPQAYFEVAASAQVEGSSLQMRHTPKDRILKRTRPRRLSPQPRASPARLR